MSETNEEIAALIEAVSTSLEAVALLGETSLQPAMLQAVNNQINIVDALARRYR